MKVLLLTVLAFWSSEYSVPGFTSARRDCDNVPVLNREIVDFVRTRISQRVGRGECWDLAAEALNHTGANWDHHYNFGREVFPSRDCIFPGDIMQCEGVTIRYQKDGYFYEEMMSRHTSVIYEVKGETSFVVAEQNTSVGGKKVSLNPVDLRNIVAGKFRIYRPVRD